MAVSLQSSQNGESYLLVAHGSETMEDTDTEDLTGRLEDPAAVGEIELEGLARVAKYCCGHERGYIGKSIIKN